MKKFTTIIIITSVVSFWFGFGFSWFLMRDKEEVSIVGNAALPEKTENDLSSLGAALVAAGKENKEAESPLVLKDQTAGSEVKVESIILKEDCWLAVHEEIEGELGNILGAVLFSAGEKSGKIDLLRATEAGKTYQVFVYEDNGERKFDYKNLLPLKDEEGETVKASFRAL